MEDAGETATTDATSSVAANSDDALDRDDVWHCDVDSDILLFQAMVIGLVGKHRKTWI